ncbi:pyridoxal phosphate-dependent aminotransferase [Acetobacteraceae bacterium H6797]|nr:pyridoxal phosphate-dependent aminotransferase [Acetobacteraceae bacterium H6797]
MSSADTIPPSPMAGLRPRVAGLQPNLIAAVADLGREDPAVIKLWIGEGDLATPGFVADAADAAVRAGHTRYTYALGLPKLREALSAYHQRHWNVEVAPSRFTITTGGMNAIMQAIQAIVEPGEEVIIPGPAWPNLAETVRIAGAEPVTVPFRRAGDGSFSLDLGDIEAAITPRTRMIAINSPSNPTGWVMPSAQMEQLRDLVRAKGLWLISDEVYNHFCYGNAIAPSFLQVCTPDDRLIITNTFSKNWAMTGWRAGWMIFPEGLAPVFDNLSQYNTTSIPTFIQHACIEALEKGDGFIRQMVSRCAESRQIVCEGLAALPGITLRAPEGSFYVMFSVEGVTDSLAFAIELLKEAKVGLAPGAAFGPDGEGQLRLCFAISPELAREAVARLSRFFLARAAKKA